MVLMNGPKLMVRKEYFEGSALEGIGRHRIGRLRKASKGTHWIASKGIGEDPGAVSEWQKQQLEYERSNVKRENVGRIQQIEYGRSNAADRVRQIECSSPNVNRSNATASNVNRMQQLGYEVHIENSSNASAVRDAIADHRNGM